MYDYGNADLAEKGRDTLARIVVRRYREAVGWASTELVGRDSLRTVLGQCHDQLHGVPGPAEVALARELGAEVRPNLTAVKVDTASAFLHDVLSPADELPWTIGPTPIPDLSRAGRAEALEEAKRELYGELGPLAGLASGGPEAMAAIMGVARRAREKVLARERDGAGRAAAAMLRLMHDQCVEGGWDLALDRFLRNFAGYPFAVMLGPVPTRGPRLAWHGDGLRAREETFYAFESISPFDFWFSPDSRTTQDGTCVFVRRRLTRRQLLAMTGIGSYIPSQVEAVLREVTNADRYDLRWLSDHNPDQPDDQLVYWSQCAATIDALVHYGFLTGSDLQEHCGMTGLDPLRSYNVTVTIVGGHTVQAFVAPSPSVDMRPAHTASFYCLSEERIPGMGLAQKLRETERGFQAAMRGLVMNMNFASAPMAELDVNRLSKYMDRESAGRLAPGTIFLVDNDMGPSQRPALALHPFPENLKQYLEVLEYFKEQAHEVTNLPASFHGTAVGTGANRTFRGASMLQGNAIKALNAAVKRLDAGVFRPVGELMFGYNMLYEKDPAIKGDCKVMAQGAAGLLAREIRSGEALDNIQVLGILANQMGPTVVPAIDWSVKELFKARRMPDEIVDQMSLGAGQGGQGGGPPPTDAGRGVPNPNPGPPTGGMMR